MKNSTLDANTQPKQSEKAGKAPYSKPVLRSFGSVRHLTRANSGSSIDQNGQNAGSRGRTL